MNRFLPAIASIVFGLASSASVQGQTPDIPDELKSIIEKIRASRQRFFKCPGGIAIDYKLSIDQPPKTPFVIWREGCKGTLNVKWPILKSSNEGFMYFSGTTDAPGDSEPPSEYTVREGNYNFETNSGVARDGKALGQVTNYRHSFSATTCFSLMLQYFVEADQYYHPSRSSKTGYFLPDALEQHPYYVEKREEIEKVPCVVLRLGKDKPTDTIWLAENQGYVVFQREQRNKEGKLKERTRNTDLREVTEKNWVPYSQSAEVFRTGGEPYSYRIDIAVTKVRTGDLTEKDLEIVLGKEIRYIEDHISKKIYRNAGQGQEFDSSIAEFTSERWSFPWLSVLVPLASFFALVLVVLWLRLRAKKGAQ